MEVKPGARFSVERVGRRDLDRLRKAAGRLVTPARDAAIEDVLAVLRANGLRFARVEPEEIDARYASLNQALGARLDLLEGRPDVEEIATALHWSRRTVTRRLQSMARAYAFVRPHWREALRSARLLAALRLLAAPGATTELVARLTGFRAAAALCRAFADVGWPSPGRFAQAARRDPITSWRELAAAVPRYQSHG